MKKAGGARSQDAQPRRSAPPGCEAFSVLGVECRPRRLIELDTNLTGQCAAHRLRAAVGDLLVLSCDGKES